MVKIFKYLFVKYIPENLMSCPLIMKLLRWLFSDFETALVVKFEPKIFPTEKAF